ncbi:hypothetical protein BGY98DRAFT_931865 [Russula aff. rugulosa BPL654]|nr:hypothetical protein BGY98DRAFT_931865 [Russula aff. rugulosa BPL654]
MSSVPPVSTLPPVLQVQYNPESYHPSSPHLEEPLLAPRPHKLTPDLPAEMARTLDNQVSRGSIPPPVDHYHDRHALNPTPGFFVPGLPAAPAPAGSSWNARQSSSPRLNHSDLPLASHSYGAQQPLRQTEPSPSSLPYPGSTSIPSDPLESAMTSLSFSDSQKKGPDSNGPPALTAPLPTIASLIAGLSSVQSGNNPASSVAWCRDVFGLVDRLYVAPNQTGSADPPSGPIHVADQELNNLVEAAIPMVLQIANTNTPPQPLPLHIAEALFLRATFEASGAYPNFVPQNPRAAFRDFERAARAGFSAAWFKLGRDYENFGDFAHAKDCYERGIRNNNENCLYRMGMAHLMGQLGLSPSPEAAIPLLQRAATIATVDVPQPAYVFGLLLLGEFSQASIPPHLFTPLIPPGSTRDTEARRHLERAAFLNFAPAQYKLGHAYEFAQPPFPFDALLSVQYYSLASQQGEIEADMALSKWFLCGSEGAFDKDESLAYTFAKRPRAKVFLAQSGPKDIAAARKWYTRASQHGNTDATDRLSALSQPTPSALSRQEHDNLTETTLVRKRTQAKQRSDARGPGAGPRHGGRQNGQRVLEIIRKNSLAHQAGPSQGYPSSSGSPAPARYNNAVPEGYFNQRPPQAPVGSSPGSSGDIYRPPTTGPGSLPDPSGFVPPQRQQQPLQASQPQYTPPAPQGPTNYPVPPGGYPSPRMPILRPPSQPQMGTPGPSGQHGRNRTGRRSSASGPPGTASSQQAQQGRLRTPSPPEPSAPVARPPAAGKGPATFQEMGYQSSKLEDKDCVIM